ncbi:MAG: hypothetical protein ABIM50_07700 [Novosphingobium sp.]
MTWRHFRAVVDPKHAIAPFFKPPGEGYQILYPGYRLRPAIVQT